MAPAIAAGIDQALGLSGAVSRLPVDPQAILALINQAQGDSEASSA